MVDAEGALADAEVERDDPAGDMDTGCDSDEEFEARKARARFQEGQRVRYRMQAAAYAGSVVYYGTVIGLNKEKMLGVDDYLIRPDGEDDIQQSVRVTCMSLA